jgi:hypothetical protein
VLCISGIIAGGRLVVRPLYRRISALKNSDVFAATTLLVVLGTSVLTQAAGLSLALGAFLVRSQPRIMPTIAQCRRFCLRSGCQQLAVRDVQYAIAAGCHVTFLVRGPQHCAFKAPGLLAHSSSVHPVSSLQ